MSLKETVCFRVASENKSMTHHLLKFNQNFYCGVLNKPKAFGSGLLAVQMGKSQNLTLYSLYFVQNRCLQLTQLFCINLESVKDIAAGFPNCLNQSVISVNLNL